MLGSVRLFVCYGRAHGRDAPPRRSGLRSYHLTAFRPRLHILSRADLQGVHPLPGSRMAESDLGRCVSCMQFTPNIYVCAYHAIFGLVRPNNTGALYAIMAIIGGSSLTLLPVAIELACELTRNAMASSAILWCSYVHLSAPSYAHNRSTSHNSSGNVFGVMMVLGTSSPYSKNHTTSS